MENVLQMLLEILVVAVAPMGGLEKLAVQTETSALKAAAHHVIMAVHVLTLLDHLAAIVSLVTQVIAVPYDLLYPTALNNVQLNSPVSGQPNCEDLMVVYKN